MSAWTIRDRSNNNTCLVDLGMKHNKPLVRPSQHTTLRSSITVCCPIINSRLQAIAARREEQYTQTHIYRCGRPAPLLIPRGASQCGSHQYPGRGERGWGWGLVCRRVTALGDCFTIWMDSNVRFEER